VSEPLQRVRLPPEALGWDKRLQVRRWVGGRRWNAAPRFALIDRVRDAWSEFGPPGFADDPVSIVTAAFPYLVEDDEFRRYVLEVAEQTLTVSADWEAAVRTYAWAVLQRYNKELGGPDE